jgi:DNA-binding protein Fis
MSNKIIEQKIVTKRRNALSTKVNVFSNSSIPKINPTAINHSYNFTVEQIIQKYKGKEFSEKQLNILFKRYKNSYQAMAQLCGINRSTLYKKLHNSHMVHAKLVTLKYVKIFDMEALSEKMAFATYIDINLRDKDGEPVERLVSEKLHIFYLECKAGWHKEMGGDIPVEFAHNYIEISERKDNENKKLIDKLELIEKGYVSNQLNRIQFKTLLETIKLRIETIECKSIKDRLISMVEQAENMGINPIKIIKR